MTTFNVISKTDNKMKLVFATNNQHKLEEVSAILGNSIELLSLKVSIVIQIFPKQLIH